MAGEKTCTLLANEPVKVNGKRYAPGDEIPNVASKLADGLIASGAAEDAAAPLKPVVKRSAQAQAPASAEGGAPAAGTEGGEAL
jgi:hypothetical protein